MKDRRDELRPRRSAHFGGQTKGALSGGIRVDQSRFHQQQKKGMGWEEIWTLFEAVDLGKGERRRPLDLRRPRVTGRFF